MEFFNISNIFPNDLIKLKLAFQSISEFLSIEINLFDYSVGSFVIYFYMIAFGECIKDLIFFGYKQPDQQGDGFVDVNELYIIQIY